MSGTETAGSNLALRRWRQTAAIFRLELMRTFFSRRGLWVYLVALAPLAVVGLFTGVLHYQAAQRAAMETAEAASAPGRRLSPADFAAISAGMTEAAVLDRLGPPPRRSGFMERRREHGTITRTPLESLDYAAAGVGYRIVLDDGVVLAIHSGRGPGISDEEGVFAVIFQFFTLRLVLFFGCLGIFMNLFRGEVMDRSLHFYFLAPVRREVVLAGKFAAGLAAAVVIFGVSVGLQLLMLGWQVGPIARAQFFGLHHGAAQVAAYLGVTALGCLGYGAFFLAAGLYTRNPVVPAAALLVWESLNPFLPEVLKRISVIDYLVALSPVSVAGVPGVSPLLKLLTTGPGTISAGWAIAGLTAVAALLLALAAARVRRFEIAYAEE